MRYKNNKTGVCRALTFLEMVIALAMMAVVFAVIVPQIRNIRTGWDSKEGIAETLQNGRVLTDHLSRNLARAVRVTAVSEPNETTGFIEFEDNDEDTLRYDIAANDYVEFGSVGELYELAGPVSQLQFTCYDGNDFDNPTTDANYIRFVEVQTTLTNPATRGQDKTFTFSAYLRTSGNSCSSGLVGWWKLDETSGLTAADSSGNGNDGTLENMAGDEWTNGILGGALEFDGDNDYVDCGNNESLQITGREISLASWVKWDSADGYSAIAVKTSSWRWADGYGLYAHSDNTVNFYVTRYSTNRASATFTADGQWHHVVGTYDGSNVRIWVDGVEGTPDSYSGSITNANNSLEIGRGADNFYNFKGALDDVRIYNRALSAEEIEGLANILKYEEFTEAKAGSDTTSVTISTPSGASEGDLLIAAVATDGDTDFSLSPPSGEGWTEINLDDYSSEVTLGAWWKLADASESASHQFTWSGDEQAYGWMMRFTGHDPDDPIDDWMRDGETSSTPTSPAVTTTVANTMILRLGAFDNDDITVDDPGLAGHTAITMDRSASSGGGVLYEAFSEAKQSYGQELTINTPAGTGAGDLLIAAVVTDASETLSPPGGEGWTLIDQGVGSGAVTLGVWWKLADASESGSHQFTWGSNEEAYGWIMRFTGHDPISPINASQAQGGDIDSTPPSPSVSTTVADTMILRIGGFDDDDITVDNPGLSGHATITMDESSTSNFSCSGGAGWVQQAAIGASGSVNFSLTKAEQYRTVTVAIAPAAGGGGGTVSGGAGYVRQSAGGDSGTSDFSLTASNESQMLTIAISPGPESGGDCGGGILP